MTLNYSLLNKIENVDEEFELLVPNLGEFERRRLVSKYLRYADKAASTNLTIRMTKGRKSYSDRNRGMQYRAENIFEYRFGNLGKLQSQAEIDNIVARVFNSPQWRDSAFGQNATTLPVVRVQHMKNHRGSAWLNQITLDISTGMDKLTLLHEMAHTAGHRHHQASFRLCLISLISVDHPMLANEMKDIFKKMGLSLRIAKEKPIMTPSQWYAKYLKIQKARANNPRLQHLVRAAA